MRTRRRRPACEWMEARPLMAVALAFDYSLDPGFFTAERRALLESTLREIAGSLDDALAAVPQSVYSFETDSGTRTSATSVPAGAIKVYVYGDSLPHQGPNASIAQGGAYYSEGAGGSMRGQAPGEYAPDVAYLRFDDDGSTNWFFGATTAGLAYNQVDFVTVARHEFLHSLGFLGGQPAFARYAAGGSFAGPSASAAHGGPVPLLGSHVHPAVPSIMNPSVPSGVRAGLTDLEWGFLRDFGWSVSAAPAAFVRDHDLFTGGQGDGEARVRVAPATGASLLALDVLAGDVVRFRTLDGPTAAERGTNSYVRVFDASGVEVARNDDSAAGGKEDFTHAFATGGRYWVGVGAYAQREYTLGSPPPAAPAARPFYLEASLAGRTDAEPDDLDGAAAAAPVAFAPVAAASGAFSTVTTLGGEPADVFRVDALAGSSYVVTTSLPAGGGLPGASLAAVYDASGRRLAAMDGALPYGRLTFVAPADGRYFIRVARAVGPEAVPRAEPAGDPGFSASQGADYAAFGARSRGSDYALTITQAPPPAPTNLHPLYVDYGAFGLWSWAEAAGWRRINEADPEDFAVAADGSLFVDYGAFGLWNWAEAAGWRQVNGANPQAIAPASDGALFVDYGAFGLWRWTAAAGIARLSTGDPEGMAAGPSADLYVDYGAFGLWSWTAAAGLVKLNDADPGAMAAGPPGTLYVDFGPSGLWVRSADGAFSRLHEARAQGLAAGPGGRLYVDFGAAGLWSWSDLGFRPINGADPERILASADGWLYIDYGPFGLWRWSIATGSRQINAGDPDRLASRTSFGRV